jgi:mono/diheme cytochrome c family protein
MTGRSRSQLIALLVLPLLVTAGCGGAQQPPAEQARPAEQAAPAVAAADVAKHMHEHLARVTPMQEAVIRGDMEAAVEPARWIADHQPTAGLPAGQEAVLADMKKSAAVVAEAKDFGNAATATAMVVSYCGACHAAAKVSPAIPEPAKPLTEDPLVAHMLEHQWATDLLYQGLVMPSEERWQKGLAAMAGTPLSEKDLPKDTRLTKEIVALEKNVHEMAAKAKTATDLGTKVAFYGEYLAGCAGCHGLHGKVWGPGLPKTP